jgi:3-isopropylmalate/(R)-2-methylmalate dehydratase large subunit
MASIWSLGLAVNIEVPATIRVEVKGEFPPMVGPKDLILYLIGQLKAQGANFKVLEFHGETIRRMSTSGRLAICNMSVEAGATSGIVPGDEETLRYLCEEAGVMDTLSFVPPDADAHYVQTMQIDVSALAPQIACPHTVDNVKRELHEWTPGRSGRCRRHPAREEGRSGYPHAGVSGLQQGLRPGPG